MPGALAPVGALGRPGAAGAGWRPGQWPPIARRRTVPPGRASAAGGQVRSPYPSCRPACGKAPRPESKTSWFRWRLELFAGATGQQQRGRYREEQERGIGPITMLPILESTKAAIAGGPCRVRKNVLIRSCGAGESTLPSRAHQEGATRRLRHWPRSSQVKPARCRRSWQGRGQRDCRRA